MKKLFSLSIALMFIVTVSAQESFNKWSLGLETGMGAIGDQSSDVFNNELHYGGNVRYNINEVFGLGISAGYDKLRLVSLKDELTNTYYSKVNLEAYISVFEILRLRHKHLNFIAHGGPGISYIKTNNGTKETPMNVTGGIMAVLKLSKRVALSAGYNTTVHLSQDLTLDGLHPISNAGINSTVDHLTAGLTFYFGKKGRQHADFYVAPVKENKTIYIDRTITNNPVVNNITNVTKIIRASNESVYFKHDSDVVDKDGLNAISKSAGYSKEGSIINVTGYASPAGTNAYNLDLAKRRVDAVVSRLTSIGIEAKQIKVNYYGEIDTNDSKNVELSRRVDLIVSE